MNNSKEKAENALLEETTLRRMLIQGSRDGIVVLDQTGKVCDANRKFADMLGYSPEEVSNLSIWDWDDRWTKERFLQLLETVGETGDHFETRYRRKSGTLVDVEISIAGAMCNERKLVCCVCRDATDRKRTEEALRKREEHYRALFSSINDAVLVHDIQNDGSPGPFIEANQIACDRLGYTREELFRLTPADISTPDEYIRLTETRKKLKDTGNIIFETVHKTRDGRIIPVESSVSIFDYNGNRTAISLSRDISDRKRADEALRKSEEAVSRKLRAILEPEGDIGTLELSDVIDSKAVQSLMDDFYRLTKISAALLDLKGQVLVATGWQDICTKFHRVHPEACRYCLESDTELSKGINQGEFKLYRCKNNMWDIATPVMVGGRHLGNLFLGQFFFENEPPDKNLFRLQARQYGFDEQEYIDALDRVPCYSRETVDLVMTFYTKFANILSSLSLSNLKLARTLSEKERLQDQLLQARKMEAVGTLAGGIAHDFNNRLQVINGYTQIMLMDKSENDPDYQNLQAIQQTVEKSATLVRQLLLFSRKLETEKKPVDLNQEVGQVRPILERAIPKMIDIEVRSGSRLWTVDADPVQMEQILLNLANNAVDSMPDGGKLLIETENVRLDAQYVHAYLGIEQGKYVLLTVSDTGLGMDKETVEHIFEPFYTTKEIGKGTGLGLASVHGIVKSHGGDITCHSEIGQGTTFRIYLPAIERIYTDREKDLDVRPPQGGTETILLVDDEDPIRDFASKGLTRFGYTVLSASTGEEALEIYTKKSDDIHLILLDIGMPGMGGHRCMQELMRIDSDVKIIIASGYSVNGQVKETLEAGAAGYVGKPYQLADLLTTARAVLDKHD